MKTRVSFLFWHCTARTDSQGLAPISCRITVKGRRAEIGAGLRVAVKDWSTARKKVLGSSPAARTTNAALTKMADELTDLWADLERQGKPVTAQALKAAYYRHGAVLSLLELFTEFVAERTSLVGIEISIASLKADKGRYNLLVAFLAAHQRTDLRPEEMTHNMADKFLYWCLKDRGLKRNYVNKVVQTVGQVLRWGVRREHLSANPLHLYRFKGEAQGDIKFLGVGELQNLSFAPLPVPCLVRVRDCFVFQCWTGLAYADMAALNVARDAEYHTDKGGQVRRVLRVRRQKSTMQQGYECVIPLLPEAERILALYDDQLPVISNQIYNRYLKQVGDLCGIEAGKMTSHVGRKTAGTLMLNKGVPLPVVSKFLGHASTLITQKLYAKLLDTTVVDSFGSVFGSTFGLASAQGSLAGKEVVALC